MWLFIQCVFIILITNSLAESEVQLSPRDDEPPELNPSRRLPPPNRLNSVYDGENKTHAVGFKIKKEVDIQIETRNLKNFETSLNDIIKSQFAESTHPGHLLHHETHENSSNNGQQLRVERFSSEMDENYLLKHLDNLYNKLQNMENFFEKYPYTNTIKLDNGINQIELCKRMVGLSKTPECELIKKMHYDYITSSKTHIPKSCKEIQDSGKNKSGIYEIQPTSSIKSFEVYCDMETKGGGWTVIQNRFDGSEDFYREWRYYKFGFGNLDREFWIGLENIYYITGFEVSELLVELTDRDKIKAYAQYKGFGIGSETEGYPLDVLRGFSGDAGDSLADHFNAKFSTKDMDQDSNGSNCAELFKGGWWYKSCHVSNLNGKYINLPLPGQYKFQGLHWLKYRGHEYCHSGSRMMVRPSQP